MRVVRFCRARPTLAVNEAHDEVKELALRVGSHEATTDDQMLEEKLSIRRALA